MNLEEIKELIRVFGRSKLDKLKIKDKDFEISLKKEGSKVVTVSEGVITQNAPVVQTAMQQTAIAPQAEVKENKNEQASISGELITSPMVGTFYAAPSPDSPPFVNVGDSVRKGQTLCILEAMKIMNELEAEYDCKILEVLVKDGEPVEYDTPLFRVEKL